MRKFILFLAVMLGVTAGHAQVISACEYFFDTDPGIGNGTAVTVTSGDSTEVSLNVPTTGLTEGFHKLFFRVQNADGKWSLYEGRSFQVYNPPAPQVAQLSSAEYFL